MKKIISVLLILTLCLTVFCACGEKTPSTAREALELELNKVKNPDSKLLKEQFELIAGDDPALMMMFENFDMKLLYKNFDYEILNCYTKDGTATAKVKMSNLNFGSIMNDYASEMFSYILEIYNDGMSNEEYNSLTYKKSAEVLAKLIKSGKYEKAETEIEIQMVQKDGKWALAKSLPAEAVLTGLDSFSEMLEGGF